MEIAYYGFSLSLAVHWFQDHSFFLGFPVLMLAGNPVVKTLVVETYACMDDVPRYNASVVTTERTCFLIL